VAIANRRQTGTLVNAASGHGSGSGGRNVSAARDAVFTARPGGIAEVLGHRLAAHRLKPAGVALWAVAFVVLGAAIIVWSFVRGPLVRTLVWVIAVALPIFVGVSRFDRGMHFLTDVIAAVVLGCLALLFTLLITRSMRAAAAEQRHASSQSSPQPPPGVR